MLDSGWRRGLARLFVEAVVIVASIPQQYELLEARVNELLSVLAREIDT